MRTFAERLKEALEIKRITQTELAKRTGLDKSLISNYVAGKYKAKSDNLYLIAKALNVSEAWLMGYEVPMERDSRQDIISYQASLTGHEMRLVEAYRNNPHMQAAVNTLLGIADEEVYIPVAARLGESGTVKVTDSKAMKDALDEVLPEVNIPKKPDEF